MHTMTIKNPKTGRNIKVRAWSIEPRAVLAKFKDGTFKSVKDLSWALLDDKQSVALCEKQMDGEAAESNFALGIFEHALDWTLGLTVFNFIRDSLSRKRMPKPFKVVASRSGDVFVIGASGTVYA